MRSLRSASSRSSSDLVTRLTVERPTRSPISASVTLPIFRVEMPWTYAAVMASSIWAVRRL